MKKWYVAKTKPSKELLVKNFLTKRQDTEAFLPFIRSPKRTRTRMEVLFPTYIFCLADPASPDWGAIRWAPGISYFLGAGAELVPVSDKFISHLKLRVSWWNDGGYELRLVPGDEVVITDGPFSGLEAIFQRYVPARQRCQVLLQFMNRQVRAEIPLENLGKQSPYQNLKVMT